MKTARFKKIISLTCAVVMLLTVCIASPLSVSATTVKVTVNNSGNVYDVNATVGEKLPNPERVNGMLFLGWYSDPACTVEYGTVAANESRTAYAKYNNTFLGFNNYGVTRFRGNDATTGIVTAPDDENNKVFRIDFPNIWANAVLAEYDAEGADDYTLIANHSYTVTFKFMFTDVVGDNFQIRLYSGTNPTGTPSRTTISGTAVDYSISGMTAGTWYTYSKTFNSGALTTGDNLFISVGRGTNITNPDDFLYFDNITIIDNTVNSTIGVDNTYTGFETDSGNFTASGTFRSSTAASITTEDAHNGDYALKIAPGGTNTYRSFVYNGNGSHCAIKLESYKYYRMTFWYKAAALTDDGKATSILFETNSAQHVWDGQKSIKTIDITSAAKGEWIKQEISFTSGDCSKYAYLAVAISGTLGDVVYFDDFTVTQVSSMGLVDYVADFDNSADFAHYRVNINNLWPYYCSNVTWSVENGVLSFSPTNNTQPSTTTSEWIQHFIPYDGASYYKLESGYTYRVAVRYKQTAASGTKGYFSLASKSSAAGSASLQSVAINTLTGTTDWKEYSFRFTATDYHASKPYITMTFGGSGVKFEVDYIMILKETLVNNNGEISKLTTAAGSEIPEPKHDSNLRFIGWYSDLDFTKPYGVVQQNEKRNAYAKYDKTLITFGSKGFTSSRNDAAVLKTDPEDASNGVVYIPFEDYWSTLEPAKYDDIGATYYKLTPNCEYTIKFDFKVSDSVTEDLSVRMNSGTVADYNASYPKYVYDATTKTYTPDQYNSGWNTYTTTFNSGDLAKGDHLFITAHISSSDYTDKGLYIDNISIYNSSEFVEVTTNKRGVISTVNTVVGQTLPDIKSYDEQIFLGWYSDPACTVPFGTVRTNESRTAYAKYDTVKVGFTADSNVDGLVCLGNNYVVRLDTGKTLTVPCYDALDAGALALDANTTYAARFVYKVAPGSDAGKLTVLGNDLRFEAVAADAKASWSAGAIIFTTEDAQGLQLALNSDGNSTVYIDDILVYTVTETPEVTVSSGSSTATATAPVAKNNMQTGVVTLNIADGEQLAVKGLTVTYDLYATAFSEKVSSKIILSEGAYDLGRDGSFADGTKFVYMVPAAAKNIKITAEFTSDTETNIGIIAGSVRKKDSTYNSGLRFRGRVYNEDGISKVGFILAPEKLITGAGYTLLTLDNAAACQAVKADATGIIYDRTDAYTDYQVLLTGMDNLLGVDIQCRMYIEYSDGTVKYADAATLSYNSLIAKMNKTYRGITDYYNEEYENLRDKLITSQADGKFSFIMLTDTHIDYTKSVSDSEYWYTSSYYVERYVIQREIATIIELANTSDVDCVILGGDLIHGTSSYANSKADLQYFADMFSKCKVPVYVNRGNHDNNDYHGIPCPISYIIDQEDWTDTILDPLARGTAVHDANDSKSTYYYVDFADKNTRLIVLDPYNYPVTTSDGYYCDMRAEAWAGMEDAQLKWLATVALDAEKQGWTYVLSAHAPIYGPETFRNSALVRNIVEAFNNKTSVTVNGWTVDYTNTDGTIPFSVSGHTHVSSYRMYTPANHVCINTGSGKISYYPSQDYSATDDCKWYHPVRYEGQYTEALFDVITYSPDGTITRYNFGANCDNVFEPTDSGYTAADRD